MPHSPTVRTFLQEAESDGGGEPGAGGGEEDESDTRYCICHQVSYGKYCTLSDAFFFFLVEPCFDLHALQAR